MSFGGITNEGERNFALACLEVGCEVYHQVEVGDSDIDFLVVNPQAGSSGRASHLRVPGRARDGEAGALYPINYVLLSRMPIEQAFVWLMVIRFGLASVFMYAFARSIGLVRTAGWAAAESTSIFFHLVKSVV